MRFQFMLSEIGHGVAPQPLDDDLGRPRHDGLAAHARRRPAAAEAGRRHEGVLVRPGPGLGLPVRQGLTRRSRAAPAARSPRPRRTRSRRADARSCKPYVEQVFYESKQEAYEHLKEQFKDSLADNVTPDQMPESYRVRLNDPEQYEVVAERVPRPAGRRAASRTSNACSTGSSPCSTALKLERLGDRGRHDCCCSVLLVATTIRLDRVHPAPGDRDHASGRGLERRHPDAVHPREPDLRRDRRGAGVGDPRGLHAVRGAGVAGRHAAVHPQLGGSARTPPSCCRPCSSSGSASPASRRSCRCAATSRSDRRSRLWCHVSLT